MKIRVTMKDPDTLNDAIEDAVKEGLAQNSNLSDDEQEALSDLRIEKAYKTASQWFQYGEYLTVEIDTDENTCTVIKT